MMLKKRAPRPMSRFSHEAATGSIYWHGDVCVAWRPIIINPEGVWQVAYEDLAEALLEFLEEGGLPDVPERDELIAALVRCI